MVEEIDNRNALLAELEELEDDVTTLQMKMHTATNPDEIALLQKELESKSKRVQWLRQSLR